MLAGCGENYSRVLDTKLYPWVKDRDGWLDLIDLTDALFLVSMVQKSKTQHVLCEVDTIIILLSIPKGT